MKNTQKTEEAIGQAESAIRAVVKKLIENRNLRRADGEDVEQILRIHVANKATEHNPEKASLRTFIERIVANKIRDILEEQHAQCRDCRKEVHSLDEPGPILDDEQGTFGDSIDVTEALCRAGLLPWPEDESLIIDLKLVLEDLSEVDRLTCEVLGATKSLREAAGNLGIHVETLRQRVSKIRIQFQERGIHGV